MSRSGPEPGAFVVEPVANGWIVQHWPIEVEVPEAEDEGDAPGYDPSAAFAESMSASAPEGVRLIGHLHMSDDGPDPVRYVFQFDQMENLLALIQGLTQQTRPAQEAEE